MFTAEFMSNLFPDPPTHPNKTGNKSDPDNNNGGIDIELVDDSEREDEDEVKLPHMFDLDEGKITIKHS